MKLFSLLYKKNTRHVIEDDDKLEDKKFSSEAEELMEE